MRLCRYSGLNSALPPGSLVRSRLLQDRRLVTKLVREFDELKPLTPGAYNCPADVGSVILALLGYTDGEQVTIEVDITGCQFVTNGDVAATADGFGTPVGPTLEHELASLIQ